MSSVLAELRALLARYDDAAFEALANRGLLRRASKDLEKDKPTLAADTGTAVEIKVGDRQVRMDARGPSHADCTCPAAGVCQHILVACLWLKETAGETAPLEALNAELMSFDVTTLEKWSGAPAYRWAYETVRDLDAPDQVAIGGERNVVIEFSHPRFSFRYLGGGLDSAIVDLSVADTRKYVVAAVLAYQRAQGRAMTPPPERRRGTRALELGQEHAVAEGVAADRSELRTRVLESADRLALECVLAGLSHLSAAVSERFTTLAVSAQGADLHRLALLLRRLGDHADMLLAREGGADEARMLDDLALLHALLAALRAASVDRGAEGPRKLVGESRSAYETMGAIELDGVGALPWRTQSGHVGLTLYFRGVGDGRWYTWSESRPAIQRFDPIARFKAAGPWTGVGSPAALLGKRFSLLGAQSNRFGRLSAAATCTATVQGDASVESLMAGEISDWSQLEAHLHEDGGTLAERDPRRNLVVLRPARTGSADFDSIQQRLLWPLHDAEGRTLLARLAFSELTALAISRIENLGTSAGGNGLLARLHPEDGTLVAEPIALIDPKSPDPVDAIYFESRVTVASRLQRWKEALQSLGASAPAPQPLDAPAAGWRFLEPIDAQTLRLAERGVMDIAVPAVRDLEAKLDRGAEAGFSLPKELWAAAPAGDTPRQRAAALLRVRHALRALQQAS